MGIPCVYCDEFQAVGPAGTCDHCEPMPGAPRDQRGPEPIGEPAPSVVYRIVHVPTGRLYVGVHRLPDGWGDPFEDDGYQGSGDHLAAAIDLYTWAQFEKDVLAVLPTKEAAFELEAGLVGPEQVASRLYFNLCVGGRGGFAHLSEEAEARRASAVAASNRARNAEMAKDPKWREAHTKAMRERAEHPEWRARQRELALERKDTPKGKAHLERFLRAAKSPDALAKMSATNRERAQTEEGRAHIEKMNRASRTPESRARMSAAARSPERLAQLDKARRASFASEARAKGAAAHRTPEARERKRASARRQFADPAARAKFTSRGKAQWAHMTPEERVAEGRRRLAVGRENKRRKREVALIVLALVAAAA